MEEDEEKSVTSTNYYGGIIHVKVGTNSMTLIVLLNIVFYGLVVFGGVQLCRVGYSFACGGVGYTSKYLLLGQTKAFTISEDDGEFEVAKRLSNQDLVGKSGGVLCAHAVDETRGNRHAERYLYAEQQYDLQRKLSV